MELIDTHCHLNMLEHKSAEQAISDAVENGVTKMICIGAADKVASAKTAVELAEAHENVWATVGIHPHDAGCEHSVEELEQYLDHPRVVAVGETGLDFFRDWSPFDKQQDLFEATISLALNAKKPLIIHCRDAANECFETLKRLKADSVGGVFHCYGEDAEFAKKLKDINFLVSFPGVITFKKAEALRETAKKIDLQQIMLETDCPYMAPEPHRGKPSEPAHVYWIAKRLAEVKEISFEELASTTSQTAMNFFNISEEK